MPGLPGTPGRSGIDGKRGLPGNKGEQGSKGDDGKTGDKGDTGENGKDGSRGEPGPPGLPGRQVIVTPEGATNDEVRQAFPIPMGPPGATGSPGTKGDQGGQGLNGEKGDAGAPGKSIEMKDIEIMFEAYGIRLPLLKALIDRLLQEGIEELLHVLGTVKGTKEKTDTHTSNVITEYSSPVKFDLTSQTRSDLDVTEDPDLDGGIPDSTSVELDRIETKLNGSRWTKTLDGNTNKVSSLKINRTEVNSTYNYTTAQETVSGLPETVVETVVLTQDDSLKKSSGQKKKNRERGKGKGNKGRHKRQRHRLTSGEQVEEEDEEFYNAEEYDDEYEEELSPHDSSSSQESRDNREVASTTTDPPSQPLEDVEEGEVSLPSPPVTTGEPDKDFTLTIES